MSSTHPLKRKRGEQEDAAPDPILTETPHRRMVLGAERGLKVVTVFYGLTLIGFVLTGGHLFDGRSFGVIDVGFMYFAWGLFGGALGALAAPMARSAMSSIPVAALIFVPLAVAVSVMSDGWMFWRTRDLLFVPIASVLMGLFWGPLAWKRLHEDDPSERRPS